jgi:hypothetical protein
MNLASQYPHIFSGLSCAQERRSDQFARRAVRARQQGRRLRRRGVRRHVPSDGLPVMNLDPAFFFLLLRSFGVQKNPT